MFLGTKSRDLVCFGDVHDTTGVVNFDGSILKLFTIMSGCCEDDFRPTALSCSHNLVTVQNADGDFFTIPHDDIARKLEPPKGVEISRVIPLDASEVAISTAGKLYKRRPEDSAELNFEEIKLDHDDDTVVSVANINGSLDNLAVVTGSGRLVYRGSIFLQNLTGKTDSDLPAEHFRPLDLGGKKALRVWATSLNDHSALLIELEDSDTGDISLCSIGDDVDRLGRNATESDMRQLLPIKFNGDAKLPAKIKTVSAFKHVALVLFEDGKLWCWGKPTKEAYFGTKEDTEIKMSEPQLLPSLNIIGPGWRVQDFAASTDRLVVLYSNESNDK